MARRPRKFGREELLRGLTSSLRCRNLEQTVVFKSVFQAHEDLLHLSEKLRQQTLEQDKEIIILRHKLTEGLSQGEASDTLRGMQNELQRLQAQVSDKYRSSAEAASEQLRLMKEAQSLQERLKRSATSLEKLQAEHGATMSRCTKLEDSHNLLEAALAAQRAETESLRNLLGGREAEAARLREQARKEREELVSRLLRDKESMLEEMNKMNDENAALRAEKQAVLSRLKQQDASLSRQPPGRGVLASENERSQGVAPEWLSPRSERGDSSADALAGPGDTGSVDEPFGAAMPKRCVQAIEAHSSGINDVVFERNGVLLVTAGDDSYVKVWDPVSGRQKAALKGAAHKGVSVMLTADLLGDVVCGGGSDGSCTVWSLKTGREKARLTGHQQKVCALAFCSSGTRLVTGSQDCSIKLWDLHRGHWDATTTVMRATSKCNALDVSPTWRDGSGTNAVIASGHMDGVVRLWDMRSGTCAHQLQGLHTDQVTSVKFAPGKAVTLLTNSKDSTLKLVDARTYRPVATLSHPGFRTSTSFSRASLSPWAHFAAAASSDGSVYVWDIARSTEGGSGAGGKAATVILKTHGRSATGCDWCLNSPAVLASCDAGGGLRTWA